MILFAILNQTQLAVADSLASITKKFSALPDSLSAITPEKLQQGIKDLQINEALSTLTETGVTLALRLLAALAVFIVGRFIIKKVHNLLRAIMVSRDVDRSLTTFLLSLFKITFFFILAIIVISILGIETSSFIAIFASAGIAIGMAFSGTLQNFAGGVLILLLKPFKVGDYIEYDKYQGTVKEIQIFHTIISTYNNESIIIPNGGLSTGTINNYSREKSRRLEWRVAISYGDDVEVARKAILDILNNEPRLLKPGTENENIVEKISEEDNDSGDKKSLPWHKRWLRRHKQLQEKAAEWREERQRAINSKMPKIDYTPYVAVENLDSSSVTLIVRAWCVFADYWSLLYSINEAVYKELPKNGIHFPFPQLDVHYSKKI